MRPTVLAEVLRVDDRAEISARADAVVGDALVLVIVERPDAGPVCVEPIVT